jgi:hypothetical protein
MITEIGRVFEIDILATSGNVYPTYYDAQFLGP